MRITCLLSPSSRSSLRALPPAGSSPPLCLPLPLGPVQEGVRKTGYTDFSLLSLSCSDYLALPAVGIELRNRLRGERISLQLPSQRVDRFDENIANIMGGSRASPSITFAPEAGTQASGGIFSAAAFGSPFILSAD